VNTLARYLIRELARVLALCWLGLAAAYLLVEFFGRLDNFLASEVPGATIALYLAASVPQALLLTGPLSALLAAVITTEILARNNELVAMRACAIPPRAVLAPPLAAALCLSLGLVAFGEFVAPPANREAARIWDTQVAGGPQPSFAAGRTWYRGEGSICSFRLASEDGKILNGLTIYRLAPDFYLSERLDARQARYLGRRRWELTDGLRQRSRPGGGLEVERFERLRLGLRERPEDVVAGQRNPQEMSSIELWQFAGRLSREGYDPSRFLAEMQAKLAFSLGTAVMVALGLVFSLRRHRGGMAAAIGFSLLAAFLFWATQATLVSLGRTGVLPWWLAPWGADAIFSLAALRLWFTGPVA
jgi:lipopolysaccharide export system permease protein